MWCQKISSFFFLSHLSTFNLRSPEDWTSGPSHPSPLHLTKKIFFEEGGFCWWGLFTLHVSSSLKETINSNFHYILRDIDWQMLIKCPLGCEWQPQRGHSLNVCEMVFQFFLIGSVCLQFLKSRLLSFFSLQKKRSPKRVPCLFFLVIYCLRTWSHSFFFFRREKKKSSSKG